MNKNKNEILRVIVSGGGTGGHIFPAISIANALKILDPSLEILFVGAENRMEMEKVPAAGFKIVGLPVSGFNRQSMLKNFSVLVKLLKSVFKANSIIKDFKPHAVVGVGGYASGPVMWIASQKGIPIFIQEQNSYAGVTNKMLAKKATAIFVAYQGMSRFFPVDKIIISGNPVRKDLENTLLKKEEAFQYFGIPVDKPVVLSIGGSLGARSINQAIASQLQEIGKQNISFIWQTGGYYHDEMKKQLDASGVKNVYLHPFISRMDLAYAAADVIISRAGAGSISELCIVGKPVILVPSPNVAEDHQTKNAMALASKGAAHIVKDSETKEKLWPETLAILNDKDRRNTLSQNIAKLALYNSAENIAREILRHLTHCQ